MNRRRFLNISAIAACAIPSALGGVVSASSTSKEYQKFWRGRAFGADVFIRLAGGSEQTNVALDAAVDTITRMERLFSIYDPMSHISKLNREGSLKMPPEFGRLVSQVDHVNRYTDGLFDPTVQPIFERLLRTGGDLGQNSHAELKARVGWHRVQINGSQMRFSVPDMALTLNGIAQGFATDRVIEVLASHDFGNAIVNIGEYRAGATAVELHIQDAVEKEVATVRVENGAVATSSRGGYTFANGAGHILSVAGNDKERWETVSVVADTATRADGYSTALMLSADTALAERLIEQKQIRSAILVDKRAAKILEA